jgi:hypothetical protein
MKLPLLIASGLLGACAISHDAGNTPVLSPRLPVVVSVGGQIQERDVRLTKVYAGQVVVEGIWTVIFSIDKSDMTWIRDLRAQHDSVALQWGGYEVWAFPDKPSGDGYFIDRGFNDEATARRVAEEIKTKQCVSGN